MIRGERLIKHSDSWFFAKSIEVERFLNKVALEFTLRDTVMASRYPKKLRNVVGWSNKALIIESSQTRCAKVFCQERNSSEFKLRPIIAIY